MERIFKKLLGAIITVILAITTIFFGIRLSPGDPVEKLLGPEASQEDIENYRKQIGIDRPLIEQYPQYLYQILVGDLGQSLFKKEKVLKLLKGSFYPTFLLAAISIFFSGLFGIIGGVFCAYFANSNLDKWFRVLSLLGLAFPVFSIAPLLVLVFSIKLNLFPVSEWGQIEHVVLPSITLILPLSCILMRVARNKYLEEQNSPWVLILRGKGLSEFSVILRVTKIILPTVLNVLAIQLSVVLAGTMITETIFDIPGMGTLLFEGIQNRDYPLVQGIIIYVTLIYMIIYFMVDFINEWIDPRIME